MPVRVSMRDPLIPLPYELENTAGLLLPEDGMTGEWPDLSGRYWSLLEAQGPSPPS